VPLRIKNTGTVQWSAAFEKAMKENPNSIHFEEIVLNLWTS
jgi:hypothetical protein